MGTFFDDLIHPVGREEFFTEYWEKTLLASVSRDPRAFASLLPASGIDYILDVASSSPSSVELMSNAGANFYENNPDRPDRLTVIYEAFRAGSMVRINSVQRFSEPLGLACRELEYTFGAPVRVNLYCSPPQTQASPRHYDPHDVFIVQLFGSKRWRVYDPVVPLPFAAVPPLPFEEPGLRVNFNYRGGPERGPSDINPEELGPPVKELTLEAGDVLYLPRGFVHEVGTDASPSAHLTFGVHVVTMLDLLTVSLSRLANRDVNFRAGLPPGYLSDGLAADGLRERFKSLLARFAREADVDEALDEVAGSFVYNMQAAGSGALFGPFDQEAVNSIKADTVLERRPGAVFRLVVDGEKAGLVSPLKSIWMPPAFAAAFSFIARTPRFAVGDIPGGLSERSKLVVARRLLTDAFFTVAG